MVKEIKKTDIEEIIVSSIDELRKKLNIIIEKDILDYKKYMFNKYKIKEKEK
jgi:hypothetical protein